MQFRFPVLKRPRIPSLAQLRDILPLFAIAAGAALLVYVASQYWTMYAEQRRLAHEWNQQQSVAGAKSKHDREVANDGLTRLSIPKINLDAVIVEGTSHKALLRGPGHIKGTPSPGEVGNAVISAHRDTFFRHIYELNKGDIVTVQRNGQTFDYQVTGKEIVEPTDLSVLDPSRDARLTLITCYPTYYIGPAPKRLVVFTKLADENQARVEPAAAPGKAAAAVAH
jgi:LPXTG-site transpeptidase (sortase) family protein